MSEAQMPAPSAETIAVAVEKVLEQNAGATAPTPAQKLAQATGIYLAWRNEKLGNLPVDVFHQVEAASGDLITAIAANL